MKHTLALLTALTYVGTMLWPATVAAELPEHTARLASVRAWLEEETERAEKCGRAAWIKESRENLRAWKTSKWKETQTPPPSDLLPPIPFYENNPVVKRFFNDLEHKVLKPDRRFPEDPQNAQVRSEFRITEGWTFPVVAEELLELTQAFCHPQSPMAGKPELVVPILRRVAFFAERASIGGPVLGDFGCCAPLADAWLILTTCRPEILPLALRGAMDQGIRNIATDSISKRPEWSRPSLAVPIALNADVNFIQAIAIANRLFPNPAYSKALQQALSYVEKQVLPDGATHYYGKQNECASYHGISVRAIFRTAQLTDDPKLLEMVKKMRWYYPLSVSPSGVMEYSSAPSWHHYWNTYNGAAAAAILSELHNCAHNQRVANLGFDGDLWQAAFWNPKRTAAPWPDNYVTYDQNVDGPRARYGTWSYVGTTRQTLENRGKSSYVGCVVETGAPGLWQLDSALQDVGMEIRPDTAPDQNSEHRGRITLANTESVTTCAVSDKAAALGAVSQLGQYRKAATDWIQRQVWLFTPERMVGLVTVEAGADLSATGIIGRLYLVSGRSRWGQRKEIKELGGSLFSYGKLRVQFHAHDFASFVPEYTDVMAGGYNASSAKKSCIIQLVDEFAQPGAKSPYPRGTKKFYLVEIRPDASAPAAVQRIESGAGVLGFTVKDGSGSYQVFFNPTEEERPLPPGLAGTMHRSGERFRPDWLRDAGAVESVSSQPAPANGSLPPGKLIFTHSQ